MALSGYTGEKKALWRDRSLSLCTQVMFACISVPRVFLMYKFFKLLLHFCFHYKNDIDPVFKRLHAVRKTFSNCPVFDENYINVHRSVYTGTTTMHYRIEKNEVFKQKRFIVR